MQKIVLVDGNALAYRSLFSHETLTTKINEKKVFTGMPFGFLKTLISISNDFDTNQFVIFWDGGSDRKKQIYPKYKRDRKIKQKGMSYKDIKNSLKLCQKIIKRIGLKQYRVEGEEGDDIIASYAKQNPDHEYLILSNDHDFFQLLNKNIQIVRFKQGSTQVWTKKTFFEEYRFKPKYYADYLSIIGDTTDKIPGIKGIGPKSGSPIFRQISKPNLKNIYKRLDDLDIPDKLKTKFKENKGVAEMFIQLTKFKTDIELVPIYNPKQNARKLLNLFIELEFRSIYEHKDNMSILCGLKSP